MIGFLPEDVRKIQTLVTDIPVQENGNAIPEDMKIGISRLAFYPTTGVGQVVCHALGNGMSQGLSHPKAHHHQVITKVVEDQRRTTLSRETADPGAQQGMVTTGTDMGKWCP